MGNKKLKLYWLLSMAGIFIASFYPLRMGIQVITDMVRNGSVMQENYPKYVIPYTPIAFAVILGVLLLPVLMHICKRFAMLGGAALSIVTFFICEHLFENVLVVTTEAEEMTVRLEDWQMYMCSSSILWGDVNTKISAYKTHTAVEILMGEYSPAFKLHFYLISVVLILAILNCVYGFAQIIKTGDTGRKKVLILQSVSTATFLGLCILACFTAFWRDGNITVSPLSAILMALFFAVLGVTAGILVGSFLLRKTRPGLAAIWIPTIASSITTFLMYIGEMILLHGHLYRFGNGFLFDGIPAVILAPVDILVILTSGLITYLLTQFVHN